VAYVCTLFGGYLAVWRTKRALQRRATGVDPDVLGRSTRPLQRYFARMTRVLTAAAIGLIAGHAAALPWPPFTRFAALDDRWADHVGLAVGIAGLLLCALAQRDLGSAWRVGIDEATRTPLVQRGLYAHVRNPTYLGLFLVLAGFWLVWPSASVAAFGLVLFVLMEVQVRCEEEHLEAQHGEAYRVWRARTRRYLPHLY
jgi:protein-S-isoprenylcysteine O-methyltransferase Ste14